ncbi:cupin domain-containing protein [Streptomyces sp. CRN 30]|uniref:cupin domain-containing protein n=1 Tax=Streptomyces sp. CRN 30 TaxID=3075613 RepID=UPI002A8356B1|nr:cupin domain-containing protein [Streptomyces sp. CRN 30]
MSERTPTEALTTTPRRALLTRHAEAETCADPSSVMTLLADSDSTGGSCTSYRSTFSEGAVGAPAHFHTRATELFFVISGSLQVLVGEEVTVLNEGDFLAVPPHTPHAFAAAPGAEADVLFSFTPGMDRFDYLRLLGRVMRGEADPKEIAESAERFDNHYVDSPVWRAALEASTGSTDSARSANSTDSPDSPDSPDSTDSA